MSDRTLCRTCVTCGAEFQFERGRGRMGRKYCSQQCKPQRLRDPDNPPCPEVDDGVACGRPWRTPGSGMCAMHYQRTIRTSGTKRRRRTPTGECLQCGAALTQPKLRLYCSEECGYLNRNGYKPKAGRLCPGCGVTMDESFSRKQIYCTRACGSITMRYLRYGADLSDIPRLRAVKFCQICGGDGPLVLDHCHKERAARGMLCTQCNVGIGMFRDDETLLRRAIEYLRI